jgi:hypothetical protein
MQNRNIFRILQERFGDPIGDYAGDAPAGVRSDPQIRCPVCGTGDCECQNSMNDGPICSECGMMVVEGACGCTHEIAEAKKKGPSRKTARKILQGTKTFKDKMKKVEKWADDPAAAAGWMMKKAGYKE